MADDLTEEVTPEPEVNDAAPAADAAPESDPFDTGADSFDRSYVERLRKESASYRTKAKEYEDYAKHFEPYNDDDRAVWQEAMRRFNEDPKQGAEYLDAIAKAVLAEYQEQQDADAAPITDENDKPLTRAEYARLREEERVAAEQAKEVERIESEAKALGYEPTSDEYTYLLTVASRLSSGSLEEAHAKIEAAHKARVEAEIARMAAEAAGSPTAPNPGAGNAPSGERSLKTWEDADRAARARLEAQQIGEPTGRGRRR